MRFTILVGAAIIIAAAVINIHSSFTPLNLSHFVAATVLAVAVAIQRVSAIEKYLNLPRAKRKDQVDLIAQQTLINLCTGRAVTSELLHLRVHVWEVPLWYRRLIPYAVRRNLKRAVRRRPLKIFSSWAIRPSLRRVAAVGLLKQAPSGVRFCKGIGLIGVCLANNDHAELVTLQTSDARYVRALRSTSEAAWQKLSKEITHNISLEDAKRLSHSYGQVMACVVQDPYTGEGIGCVTISVKDGSGASLQIVHDARFEDELHALAMTVGPVLA